MISLSQVVIAKGKVIIMKPNNSIHFVCQCGVFFNVVFKSVLIKIQVQNGVQTYVFSMDHYVILLWSYFSVEYEMF